MSLKSKQGLAIDYTPFIPVIIRPVAGMWTYDTSTEMPKEASPDMLNCTVLEGFLRKRPGFVQYKPGSTTLDGPVIGLYSTQNDADDTHLIALTATKAYKWNTATDDWDEMTANGTALSGNNYQPFVFETSQNSIVFGQGVDPVQVHSISTSNLDHDDLDAACPAARYMTRFVSRLILAYTQESGLTKPFRIRRSVALDHTDWAGVGSGFTDMSEFPYHLRGIRKQGATMVIYTTNSISVAVRTEIAAAPYRIDIKDVGTGLYCERSLKDLPSDEHVFLSNDNVYRFNGVRAIPCADQIRETLFQRLRSVGLRRMFAELIYDTQEYLLFTVQDSVNEFPDTIWAWSYNRNVWYPWSVRDMCSAALHRLDDTSTIDGLAGTIDEQTFEFDSRTLEATYPALLTGGYDGKVYRWGFDQLADDGTEFTCRWTSKDFRSGDVDQARPHHRLTLRALHIEYEDTGTTSGNVWYSEDGGSTWLGPYAVTLGTATPGAVRTVTVGEQVTGERIRFKFEHTDIDGTFKISRFIPIFEIREPLVV